VTSYNRDIIAALLNSWFEILIWSGTRPAVGRGRADLCEVSPNANGGHQNNGAGSPRCCWVGRDCLCLHSREAKADARFTAAAATTCVSLKPWAPSDKGKVLVCFPHQLLDWWKLSDVMWCSPFGLNFTLLVPLLGRRISFGDAALDRAGYILVGAGVYVHGFMLSAVPAGIYTS
jgi:hypothetical protein